MRAFVVGAIVAAIVGLPSAAGADGGAYFSLDETYYVAGDTAVATTYVAIPKSRAPLLDRGPFYAYVLDQRSSLRAGSSIPLDAARVGVFTVVHEDGSSYELETRFTMPSLAPGWHSLQFCNDPCTITGFREPLEGSFYVVETAREAALLIENGKLRGQLSGAHRETAKAERALSSVRQDLADAESEATTSADQLSLLESQLATAKADAARAQSASDTQRRAALIVGIELALGGIALILLTRRRRAGSSTPGDVAIT
jgi:hypothetical protein